MRFVNLFVRKMFLTFLLSLGLLALTPGAGYAQAPTGTIAGALSDPSGALIADAKVIITNKETGLTRAVTTEAQGNYSAAALPAGPYQIRVEAPGFAVLAREAGVEAGKTTTVNFSLTVGTTREVVNVEGASSQISYDSQAIDGVVTRLQIENLPLNGRNFLELAKLEPGVSVTSINSAQANRQFDVSVFAAPGLRTRVTVDGGNVMNWVDGGTATNFSQETIREFQISTANFDLSTGVAAAGAVNIVTRSGGNEYHGSGFSFFRDHNLAAYPALNRDPLNPDPFFARRQSGFYFGGPIKKDRAFFFTNLEHNNQDGVVTVQPRAADFAHLGVIAPSPITGKLLGAKFDFRLNERHSGSLRYSHDGNNSFSPLGGTSLPSTWLKETNWSDQSLVSLTSLLRPNVVNDLRFSYLYWNVRDTAPTASDCRGCFGLGAPSITVVGTNFSVGNGAFLPQGADIRTFNLVENLTWQKGLHRFRFGAEWEHQLLGGWLVFYQPAGLFLYSPDIVRLFNSNPSVPPQLRIPLPSSFNTVEDILQLPLASFVTGIGDPSFPPPYNFDRVRSDDMLRFYWQDTWRVRPRFTLNYGLSYFYRTGPVNADLSKPAYLAPILGSAGLAPSRRDTNNVAPSVGFAWAVTKDNRTVIRGGAGIYYDNGQMTWQRTRERIAIGPRGNGLFILDGSIVPNPIPNIPGVPVGRVLSFNTGPTAFTGAHLLSILPGIRAGLQQQLGDPRNTDLSVRNVEVFKQAMQIFTQDYTTAYSEHFSIGAQRELRPNWVLNADFVFRQFIHTDMGAIDYNHWDSVRGPVLPACTGAQQFDPRALCSTGPITVHTSGGRFNYKGLLLRLDKRFSHGAQLLASYALSSARGFNGVVNKDDWFESFGPLGSDRRHLLNLSGVVTLPWSFQVSFVSTASSGPSFNANISAVDFNGDGTNGDRLPGSKVNQFNRGLGKSDLIRLVDQFNQSLAGGRTPRGQLIPRITLPSSFDFGDSRFSQDVRVSRSFQFQERYRLVVLGEVFNLFNVANLSGFSGNLRETTSFGQPTDRVRQVFGSGGPRAFQFGARFSF